MDNRWSLLFAVILISLLISCGCTSMAPSSPVPASPVPSQPDYLQTPSSEPSGTFTLKVDSLVPVSALPEVYSCNPFSVNPITYSVTIS
ncbi:MAG: hypothetical protein Q7V05_15155 [Methanoregula sp.]|nr:hypothetical protein [Methanoregula sp.]